MIVPQYWAEARLQQRDGRKTRTVRRWGWSDDSQAAAQAMADQRAADAMARLVAGETIPRRELKRAYNGAEGVPIREEVVDRRGDTIITRNSYGALCLNSPGTMFVDVDEEAGPGPRWKVAFFLLWLVAMVLFVPPAVRAGGWRIILPIAVTGVAALLLPVAHRTSIQLQGGTESILRRRISRFLEKHTSWNLRLYRTPAGYRLMATHQPFDPRSAEVVACFSALGADPVYVRMCINQNCFRARVSPKPWRVGISRHLRPRPGVWPVAPDRLPERMAWIAAYEPAAARFASCQFLEAFGSRTEHAEVRAVQQLHDEMCQAHSRLPLA